jgi:hypothetical protein
VGPGGCSCSSACRHQASAPTPRGKSQARERARPCWAKFDQARTKSEQLLFAERLRAETALANGPATPYLVTVWSYLLYGPTAFAGLPYLAALAPQALPSARPALDEPLTGEIVEATDPRT